MRLAFLALPLFLLFSCKSVPPQPPQPPPAGWDRVQTGLSLLREGRTEHAERAFQNAILNARAADDAEGIAFASYHLGAARLLLDRPEEARAPLLEAARLLSREDPLFPPLTLLLADTGLRCDDLNMATTWLQQAREKNAATHPLRLAILETRLAKRSGATEDFQKRAKALPADTPDTLVLKAESAEQIGNHETALALWLHAAERARAAGRFRLLPDMLGNAAQNAASLSRYEEAVTLATRAASTAYGQQRIPNAFHWLNRGTGYAEHCPDSPATLSLQQLFRDLAETVNQAAGKAIEPQPPQEELTP